MHNARVNLLDENEAPEIHMNILTLFPKKFWLALYRWGASSRPDFTCKNTAGKAHPLDLSSTWFGKSKHLKLLKTVVVHKSHTSILVLWNSKDIKCCAANMLSFFAYLGNLWDHMKAGGICLINFRNGLNQFNHLRLSLQRLPKLDNISGAMFQNLSLSLPA